MGHMNQLWNNGQDALPDALLFHQLFHSSPLPRNWNNSWEAHDSAAGQLLAIQQIGGGWLVMEQHMGVGKQ
jgi:hypothetical protein